METNVETKIWKQDRGFSLLLYSSITNKISFYQLLTIMGTLKSLSGLCWQTYLQHHVVGYIRTEQ